METTSVVIATVTIVVMVAMILWLSKTSAILKDQLIPQIPPRLQTFSLARSQMAFWFVIILGSFIYMFVRFLISGSGAADPVSTGAITTQTLTLMGISVVTAGGAALVDSAQNTPEDAVNDGLRALGLNSYQDVLDLRQEIATITGKIQALIASGVAPSPADLPTAATTPTRNLTALQAEQNDKVLLLQTYKKRTSAFQTQGWFRDMTTDIGGTALHRLQSLIWTILLGGIYLYYVFWHGVMPSFDNNLMALMGISNAGYVGFKYNETQY